jgi:uncharacterized membrane protein YphA (DoxX/SURF4 family)
MRNREPRPGEPAVLGLTVVRLALGMWWISRYRWKPPPTFGCPSDGFCLWLAKEIEHPVIGSYVDVLRSLVLPHPVIFGWLAFVVETAIGISLVLGLYTRLGAFAGALWSTFLLVGLLQVPGVNSWYYLAFILLDVVFFSIGALGQLGLDRVLDSRSWWAGSG